MHLLPAQLRCSFVLRKAADAMALMKVYQDEVVNADLDQRLVVYLFVSRILKHSHDPDVEVRLRRGIDWVCGMWM